MDSCCFSTLVIPGFIVHILMFYNFLWYVITESNTYGKSTFYENSESEPRNKLEELFFDLECAVENKQICRDIFCKDPEMESGKS